MKSYLEKMKELTSAKIIILVALFLVVFDNMAFFSNVTAVYPVNLKNSVFLGSLVLVLACAAVLLLSLVCYKNTIKPVLIAVLLITSLTGYFMDSYNVLLDVTMIQNLLSTDVAEAADLISFKMILYVVFFGILPSAYIYNVNIIYAGVKKELASRITLITLSLILIVSVILIFGSFYASFIREHKSLRYYTNPFSFISSTVRYVNGHARGNSAALKVIGADAKIPHEDTHRELVIFVLGETARADRFSLNGYGRDTNPLLKKEDVISFTNFWSCGTSTAASVPCMFSSYNQSEYSEKKAQTSENLLDVLVHAGVNVLWLDNNSDSKGVALRVPYESYKTSEKNPACDLECRDVGMLANLQTYINEHQQGDIFIVLHQLGNHGPAYYKRYPAEFERYSPVCKTNQLEECSKTEIDNAYDNAILYTDYFLSEVIKILKRNNTEFESIMFYVSDHGESLGEHGLYLHGMPNFIAPDTQRNVPAIMWFGDNVDEKDIKSLAKNRARKYSHSNIFHTVLGFMEIETSIYDRQMDILHAR